MYANSTTRAGGEQSALAVVLARMQIRGATHPVQEQQAGEVVDLVLHRTRLEGVGGNHPCATRCPGSTPETSTDDARDTSPVRSGTDRQPSRAVEEPSLDTMTGLPQYDEAVLRLGLAVTGHVEHGITARPDRSGGRPHRRRRASCASATPSPSARTKTPRSIGSTSRATQAQHRVGQPAYVLLTEAARGTILRRHSERITVSWRRPAAARPRHRAQRRAP